MAVVKKRTNTVTKSKPQAKASDKGAAKKVGVTIKKPASKVGVKSSLKAKKSASAPAVPKLSPPVKAYTQTELVKVLGEQTGLDKKHIKHFFEVYYTIVVNHLNKKGPGQFTIPGLVKLVSLNKPATKARKGRNPATGETITIKAKPARRVVKARILKKFKTEVE